MVTFEAFKESLKQALSHLQDPNFEPTAVLCQVIGSEDASSPGPVQTQIITTIQKMEPDPKTPPNCRAWIHFKSLHQRFLLGLTQEETAESFHMSVRNAQRVQAEAIQVLAQNLWRLRSGPGTEKSSPAPDWESQAELELESLRTCDPNAQANIADVLEAVVDLEANLASKRGFTVSVDYVQPGLVAAAHPMVLRQTLITAIASLASYVTSDLIVHATLEEGRVKLTLRCSVSRDQLPVGQDILDAILTPPETRVSLQHKGDQVFLQFLTLAVGERDVFVVEDNPDMVYFYRRCTSGTRFHVTHIPSPEKIFEAVEKQRPDIIIIDVMLPDIDGWQLLTHLKEHESTRHIPIIVCTVVKERDLAMALGATAFLPKPFPPHQFVEALDQALLEV
jgi:CheY-like chemotaxis protein